MPSSVIHGMLYHPAELSLDIVFRDTRGTYRYFDVGPEEWSAFKRAPSKGTYLNAVFKMRHERYLRLGSAPTQFVASLTASVAMPLRDLPDPNVWGFFDQT